MDFLGNIDESDLKELLRDPIQWTVGMAKRDVDIIERKLERARRRVAELEAERAAAIEYEKRVAILHQRFVVPDELLAVPDELLPTDPWLEELAMHVQREERRAHADTVDTSKIRAALDAAGLLGGVGNPDGGWFIIDGDGRVDGHYECVSVLRERRVAQCEKRSIVDALKSAIGAYKTALLAGDTENVGITAYEARIDEISSAGGTDPVGAALRRETATRSFVAPGDFDDVPIGKSSRLQADNQSTGPPN
jgi:hypothetical protein